MAELLDGPRLIHTGNVDGSVDVAYAIKKGYAPDNELYTFEQWPEFTHKELAALQGKPYAEVFYHVTKKLLGNSIPDDVQRRIATEAYSHDNFDFDEHGNLRFTELPSGPRLFDLSAGPSFSFKDMAMQVFIPWLNHYSGGAEQYILNSTTGDTAPAGQKAVSRFRNMGMVVLMSGASPFQSAQMKQMVAVHPDRMHLLDVPRGFTHANNLQLEANKRYEFGAINSANIARIIAQQAYQVFAYLKTIELEGKEIGDPIDVLIQTGNFGHALSAIIVAREMGLPLGNIYVVTDENNALDIFFNKHVFVKFGQEIHTTSSAQDISNPSNWWRYAFMLYGHDPEKQARTYDQWQQFGSVSIDEIGIVNNHLLENIHSITVYHHQREAAMQQTYKDTNGRVILDPQTANVVAAYHLLGLKGRPIGYETARAFKFDPVTQRVLGTVATRPEAVVGLEEKFGGFEVPEIDVKEEFFAYIEEHTQAKRRPKNEV